MNEDLEELLADTRRRCRASDQEEARKVADLPDNDLLFLLANEWRPPDPSVVEPQPSWDPSSEPTEEDRDTVVLTLEQHDEYLRVVQNAQQIKALLEVEQQRDRKSERAAELRRELLQQRDRLTEMSESWEIR